MSPRALNELGEREVAPTIMTTEIFYLFKNYRSGLHNRSIQDPYKNTQAFQSIPQALPYNPSPFVQAFVHFITLFKSQAILIKQVGLVRLFHRFRSQSILLSSDLPFPSRPKETDNEIDVNELSVFQLKLREKVKSEILF